MFFKPRYESLELKLLRILSQRSNLSEKDMNYYRNLEKGFEGELLFDKWIESLAEHWLVLNDLFLETNNTTFQIDSLIISPETIYL